MNAIIAGVNLRLRKHHAPLRVNRRIGDPILLRQRTRRVDHPAVGRAIQRRRRLHLHRVIAIAQLSQGKAPDVAQAVNAIQQFHAIL